MTHRPTSLEVFLSGESSGAFLSFEAPGAHEVFEQDFGFEDIPNSCSPPTDLQELFGIPWLDYGTGESLRERSREAQYSHVHQLQPNHVTVGQLPLTTAIDILKKHFPKLFLVNSSWDVDRALPEEFLMVANLEDSTVRIYVDNLTGHSPDNRFPAIEGKFYTALTAVYFPPSLTTKVLPVLKELREQVFSGGYPEEAAKVYMVAQNSGGYHLVQFPLQAQTPLDLNVFYGSGFQEYHDQLYTSLSEKTSGICLIHGPPGSGKTSYLRYLIQSLKSKKQVIFLPRSILGELASSSFTTFLLGLREKPTLLVIEDGESVFLKREAGAGDNALVSLLLNLTDGILNDACKVQVIGTFNVDLTHIDEALLRKGRLISCRHIGKLSAVDARAAAKHLGKDPDLVKGPITLAEVFHLGELGYVPEESPAVGFKSSLGFGGSS